MALPHDANDRPFNTKRYPTSGASVSWALIGFFAFVGLLIAAFISSLDGGPASQSVTNAPANTPSSVQQPDTTPSPNEEPAR